MKIVGIIVFTIGLLAYLLLPLVNKERQCYETATNQLSWIPTDELDRNLSKDIRCERSADAILSLDTCLQNATKSSMIAPYVGDTVTRLVAIIRPYSSSVGAIKEAHNLECSFSDRYQIP